MANSYYTHSAAMSCRRSTALVAREQGTELSGGNSMHTVDGKGRVSWSSAARRGSHLSPDRATRLPQKTRHAHRLIDSTLSMLVRYVQSDLIHIPSTRNELYIPSHLPGCYKLSQLVPLGSARFYPDTITHSWTFTDPLPAPIRDSKRNESRLVFFCR